MIRSSRRYQRGDVSTQLLSLAPVWFVVMSIFFMDVQLSRNFMQRDMVDHATAVAADTAMKTLCADSKDFGGTPLGEFKGLRASAVRDSIEPLLALVTPSSDLCKLDVHDSPTRSQAGMKAVDVLLSCEFRCTIPIAAAVMCSGSLKHVNFAAKRTTVAMGCDIKEGT